MPSRLIDIPSDDIFKNDKLGLEPAIASRTQALLRRSPQAIAIDGHWGTGDGAARVPAVPDEFVKEYARLYRYFPSFVEADV